MNIIDMFRLTNKVAIVTGGYGLYGKHITTALCEAGAMVVIASRDVEKCKLLAEDLSSMNYKAEGMYLDLSDEDSINNFIEATIKKYSKIDILINNAVLRAGAKNIEDMTKYEWEEAQQVNSTGLMLVSKGVVMQMRKQERGSIINISSIQGVVGPNFMVYGNTGMTSPINYTYDKWGMVGLTKWMANYYGKYNIRVNCISPGGYDPERTDDESSEFTKNYKRLTPLGRFADDDDIKGPVVFLASDASKYVTGHNLLVDGGWTSW